MKKENYLAPEIETIEVAVEAGIATTTTSGGSGENGMWQD